MTLSTTLIYGPLALNITYDFSPATPDVFYRHNGDPGDPGTAAELSITSITSAQAPGIDFLEIFESMDSEHDLGLLSIIENICLSAASDHEEYAAAREESALDSYYESLRDR